LLEVHHPPGLLSHWTSHTNLHAVGVPVQAAALVPVRELSEPVRGLEGELAEDLHHAIPRYLWVCRLSRHRGCARHYSTASRVVFSRSAPSIGCSSSRGTPRCSNISGLAPSCGYTNFSSSPRVSLSGALALGLTHTQSRPAGAAWVPLVSTATLNP